VRVGGTISLVGFFEQKIKEFDINKVVLNDVTIRGSAGCPNFFPKIISLIETGRIKCQPLITHCYPFSKIKEAVRAMESEKETRIKILLEVQ
ncbi:MAG: hypothetical protein M1308_00375, partial [Actinobacteria bacterium]|nr:hypothetical protein [Actinomycetota bacterium]